MFHKNGRKKLEKLRMDRRKQVWYDIYVGRLMRESCPFSIVMEIELKEKHYVFNQCYEFDLCL